MSTYSTDTEMPLIKDEDDSEVFVSGSSIEQRVRLDLDHPRGSNDWVYMSPKEARQLAAALIRQAEYAEG